MKKFRWALQRLLDVTVQRELALRAELFELACKIAQAREELLTRETRLSNAADDIGKDDAAHRLPRQELFLRCLPAAQKEIAKIRSRIDDLRTQRQTKTERFIQTKRSRQSLDRLRRDAFDRYRREIERQEQKQLDESAVASFARRNKQSKRNLPDLAMASTAATDEIGSNA